MNKETQLRWTRNRLLTRGYVTRNQALGLKITRLAARIWDLEQEGHKIERRRIPLGNKKWDYGYYLKNKTLN